jgi:hypothetical protein
MFHVKQRQEHDMSTPRDAQHVEVVIAGIESTSRLLGLTGPAVRKDEPDVIHAFQTVRKHYAKIITPNYGPKLIRDWDYPDSGPRDWAIVWEEGPDDWAINVSHADVFDRSRVFAEPYNGWALCLYRP